LTHAEFRSVQRFPALDGLRGIAAVMVVLFHYGGPTWEWLNGWVGVHIFFVLSGFLITTLALREEERRGRLSLGNFYIRRAARILPVYYVVLGVFAGVIWARAEWESSGLGRVIGHYLTFNGEFVGPGQPHGHVWTLGIEQKFYLVWPVLAFAAVLGATRRAALTSALLALLVSLCIVNSLFVSYFPIVVGCLLALALHSRRGFRALAILTRPRAAIVTAISFAAVHLLIPLEIEVLGDDGQVILVYSAAVSLFLVSLLGRGPVGWLLSRRPVTFVGDRSYSLYLVQGLAGIVVAEVVPALATHRTITAAAVLAVSVLLADLLYRWVERPFIELGRRAARFPRRDPGVAEAPGTAIPQVPETARGGLVAPSADR
jgi:peptidoglycan/LPS O-acetylase OafA/YrhL